MKRRRPQEVFSVYENDDREYGKDSIHSLPLLAGLTLFAFLLTQFALANYIEDRLPASLKLSDEETHPDAFIAERARDILTSLTDLGQRVVGSDQNEISAVEIIERKIKHVTNNANIAQKIELDKQIVSGSYHLNFTPNSFVNVYKNVQNVIVRLYGENSTSALLLNSHFDSVPTSPGASDDGINCAAMLEVLDKLSRLPKRPRHDIIFLFNGAEESMLQASHGFITQHRWAKDAKVVINLEAAGNGGKEVLFQTGPKVTWLLKYYARVPHPYGQASAEEIFQSNIIPSDTDFRIFRDYGGLVGYDFAFARYGYRYHTKYDTIDNIKLGSYQHVGDNLLALVKEVSNSPEMEDPISSESEKCVYYDLLGEVMIWYSESIGKVINYIVCAISLLTAALILINFRVGISGRIIKFSTIFFVATILSWILSGAGVLGLAILLDKFGKSMSWFRHPLIIMGLYVAPSLATSILGVHIANYFNRKTNLSSGIQAQLQVQLLRIIITLILFVGTYFNIRSTYILMIQVLFNTLAFLVIKLLRLQHSVRIWQWIHLAFLIVPTILVMRMAIQLFYLFVPITGRMGKDKNPDILIGALAFVLSVGVTIFYIPLMAIIRQPIRILLVIGAAFLMTLFFVLSPLNFPYSGDPITPTPQRFNIYHTSRSHWNENGGLIEQKSGLFFLNQDRNSPQSVTAYVEELQQAEPIAEDCKKYLACGLPLGTPRRIASMNDSTWIPFEEPRITKRPVLTLVRRESIDNTLVRFNFVVSEGPNYLNLYMQGKNGAKIKSTSLGKFTTDGVMFANIVFGKSKESLDFSLEVKVPVGLNTTILDIAVAGRNVYGNISDMTKGFQRVLGSFPNWADVVPTIASYESFVF